MNKFIPQSQFKLIENAVNQHSLSKPDDGEFSLTASLYYVQVKYRIDGIVSKPILDSYHRTFSFQWGAYSSTIIFVLNTVANLDIPAETLMKNIGLIP